MACVGKDLVLWGCQCGRLQTLKRFDSAPTALLADVLSQRVVVGCANGHVELVKVKRSNTSDTTFTKFEPVRGYVQSIQAVWDDDLIVVAHQKYLSIYYVTEESNLIACIQQPDDVKQIVVGALGDDMLVISACMDFGPVISNLWNPDVPKIQASRGRTREGSGMALDVDWQKRRIITGTARGVLQLWSFSAGGIWHDKDLLQQGRQPDIRAIAAHWVEDRAITASSDGALRLWDLHGGCVISQISGHRDVIWSVSADFDFDGGQVCSAGFDGTVKLWRIKDHIELISEMPQSTKERLFDVSEARRVHVCDTCGLFAIAKLNSDTYECKLCKDKAKVSQICLPYACKLMIQELMTMNILPRLVLHVQ